MIDPIDPIKAAIAAGLLALLAFVSYQIYDAGYEKSEAKHAKLKAEAEESNKKLIIELGDARVKNQLETDRLRANNHALWLRLPKTPCGGSSTGGAGGIAGTEPLSGVEQIRTETGAEEALREYTDTVADLMYQADTVVNNCRVLAEWANGKK